MKEEIIQRLEDLVREEISEDVFVRAEDIKNEFLQACQQAEHEQHEQLLAGEGNGELKKDPLDGRFNELIHILDDRGRKFRKLRKEEVGQKLAAKEAVIEELQQLISSESNIGKAFHDFKALQQRWNDIGNVPVRTYKSLQAAYHRHVHNFYYNMKLSKDLRDLDLKRNLEFRLQLLGKIESLLALDSIRGMERMLGLYRMEWSELGPTAVEKTDELRTRYRELIGQVLQKIREHNKDRQQEEGQNLETKKSLLQKLEQLVAEKFSSPRQWQKSGEQVQQLVAEWKQTGFVPRQENDKIWQSFRQALGAYHAQRRLFFTDLKKEHRKHKQSKQDFIRAAEQLASKVHDDWERSTRELITIQKQWKEAGPVDSWDEHRLWKKFREACDRFFEAKRSHYSEMDKALEGNLHQKEELLKKLAAFAPTGNTEEDVKALRAFSAEWKSIPHVPFKDKQRLYDQYKKTLDEKYDALKLEASQVHLIKFRNNVEMLAHGQDAGHLLQREKSALQEKMKRLQSTISQYENNLGFFSNSRNLGGLLNEVEGNLTRARAELDLLKKKLKVFSEYK